MKSHWILAIIAYSVTHLLFFSTSPGFHYDEAWAANFSLRIAELKDFWPFQAMSVQTHAWHHYWIALFFRLFGSSVESFRLANILLGLLGVILLGKSLARWFQNECWASAFIFLVGLQPALVMNHRFSIELTSFHVLCFGGMVFWGTRGRPWDHIFSAVFAAIGISSHIFFVAPALAFLTTAFIVVRGSARKIQMAMATTTLLSLPFLVFLQTAYPERNKAQALLVLVLSILAAGFSLPQLLWWPSIQDRLKKLVCILGVFSIPLFLFLFEGSWSVLSQFGRLEIPLLA